MMKCLTVLTLLLLIDINSYCQNTSQWNPDKFSFSELTFHSTACNGTCPQVSLHLRKDKLIEVSRKIYKSKGVVDSSLSGNFIGVLDNKNYNRVLTLLSTINWDTLSFQNSWCCDASIKTILISYNGKYKKFKSMTPPEITFELFDDLIKLASKIKLTKYDKPLDFEDYN